MTISTTESRISYNGNGVTTVFSFPYRFLANGDLVVVEVSAAGVETVKTLTTHYTLTGAGDDAGGSVTMLVAPATGTRLVIYRDTEVVQETDYISGDPFPAETHERALDRLTMVAQEIGSDTDRSIKVPVGDSSSLSTVLPAAASRLDKFIVFDATTGETELSTVTQTQVASAVAAAYAAGSTADAVTYLPEGTGAVSDTVQNTLRKSFFSSQYETLQQAMTAAAGGILYIEGTNAITASLTPASNTTIEFLPGATITVTSGVFGTGDAILKIDEKDAVTIKGHGATITGTREGTGTNLIWMGVSITGSTNIRVSDLNCVNMAGDGFYIAEADDNTPLYSENVWIERCRAYNCMRQGLSLVSGKNVWVVDCLFSTTNGKSPEAGVDVEPSGGSTLIVNCNFINCMATMNVGGGFISVLGNNATPITTNVDLVFDNCVVYDSTTSGMVGFDIGNHKATMANDGRVLLRNCTARNTDSYGLVLRNLDKAGQNVTVENFQAIDTNTGQRTTYGGDAPIAIYATSSASWPNPGGIVIDGLKVIDNTADRGPYYINSGGTAFDNIIISRLDWRNSVGETSIPFMDAATTNTYVEWLPGYYKLDRTSNITLTARYSGFFLSNKGAVGSVTFTLPAVAAGLRFTFEVMAAQSLIITPNASDRLRPYASADTKYMSANAIGNSAIVYANQDATDWVVERFGTWTDEP